MSRATGDTERNSSASKDDSQVFRAEANSTAAISFSVNGQNTNVNVSPRVTLADALRDELGLSGTHLGCEHGVCGMCTVLIDGDASRACLVLACQLEGAEIITVEGLGKPNDLHPLQYAFSRHHGLQCGFCTPGMLMSAYDLLTHEPNVTPDELPERMSGVLCRCTGYKGILDAVAEVARKYPDGVPAPKNCSSFQIIPRSVNMGSAPSTRGVPDLNNNISSPLEILLPQTPPTVAISLETVIDATPELVWELLDDAPRLAECLPGAELTADLGNDRYTGRVRVGLGPIRLSFVGDVHVVERDSSHYSLRVLGQGKDEGGGGVKADIRLVVESADSVSLLKANAELYMSGRIAQFGRSLAGDISRDMFSEFASSIGAKARGEERVQTKGLSAWGMVVKLVVSRIRTIFRRMGGKKG